MLSIASVAVLFLAVGPGQPSGDAVPGTQLIGEDLLRKELGNPENWMDASREGKLGEILAAASAVRAKSLAPLLAKNIAYMRPSNKKASLGITRLFPAYGVLDKLGISAAEAIVNELASFDAVNQPREVERLGHLGNRIQKRDLLVRCLVDIYEQGGFGMEMARQRMNLEIQSRKGKEKQRLLDALKHTVFVD